MHKKRSPAQQLHALAVIRQDTAEQGVEARAVVVMRDMAELMHHHEVNGLVGVLHEPPGKANAVFAARKVASPLLTVSRHADIIKVSQEPFRTGGAENGLADFAQ